MSRRTKDKRRKRNHTPKPLPRWVYPSSLAAIILIAFLIRTIPSWSQVFIPGDVLFRGVDSWFHMRLADNMMANFPIPLTRDMFALFPGGMAVAYFPIMSWLIAIPGLLFDHEVVGAFLPPVFGTLTLVPVFVICKTLWRPWVGLVACGLLALFPGEFMHRTLLGFTDHHVLEIFFLTLCIMFIVLMQRNRRLLWVVLAGVSFGLHMSSWEGGFLLSGIIWVWFFLSFITGLRKSEHGEPTGTDRLCKDVSLILGIGFLVFFPNVFFIRGMVPHATVTGLLALSPLALMVLSRKLNWRWILSLVVCLIGAGFVALGALSHPLLTTFKHALWSPGSHIMEVHPPDLRVLMLHYGLAFPLFLGGLALSIKRKESLIVIVWCVVILILGLSQRRWGYCLAVNVSLLAAYTVYAMHGWVHRWMRVSVVVILVLILALPLVSPALDLSKRAFLITPGWYNSCVWLRENTPGIDGYYDLHPDPPPYGVLSWWDYGNWIPRIGRRVPVSNPMGSGSSVQWQVFLARDEDEANEYLEGIDYIMLDYPTVTAKAYAIVQRSPYGPDEVTWTPFMHLLWEEATVTWVKVYQSEEVKVFGRSSTWGGAGTDN